MHKRMKRRTTIGIAVLLAIGCLATIFVVDRRVSDAQFRDASDELLLLMTLRRDALESYFDTVRAELIFWSRSEKLQSDFAHLRRAWDTIPGDPEARLQADYITTNPFPSDRRRDLDAVENGLDYGPAHRAIHLLAKEFVSERGYYDFFLIDPAGNIIYSVEKELDFATNLLTGSLRETGLASVARRALEAENASTVVYSDFERYAPSNGAPAIFGAIAVQGDDGRPLGVLALQIPTERIQAIMQFTAGMGHSGETYLVGSDRLMRSDSRFSDVSTTLDTTVDSQTVRSALENATGVAWTDDYRGVPVLSAYGPFTLDEFTWAVMAEIDREEVFEAVSDLRRSVPLLGLALYALAMTSLVLFDPSAWGSSDFDEIDVGDMSFSD